MTIREELELDASAAEATIDALDHQLQRAAQLFGVALADAVSILNGVQVTADASPVSAAITDAVDAADTTLQVAADVAEAEGSIAGVVSEAEAGATVPVDADSAPAQSEIDAFEAGVAELEARIAVEANTDAAAAEIQDLVAFADGQTAVITAEADVSGASSDIHELSDQQKEAGDSGEHLAAALVGVEIAAGAAEGSAGGLTAAIGEMGGEAAAAVGIVSALAASTFALFRDGVTATGAQQQFNATLGDFADQVEEINVGGLNEDLATLAESLGTSDADAQRAAAAIFQLGSTSSRSKEQVAETTEQILALAARAKAARPDLGDMADVATSLTQALARGGRATARFGLDLSSTEVQARAAQLALADGRDTVTQFDKTTAGAQLAVEKFGDTLGTTVAVGSQNATIHLSSLKAEFQNALEEIGKPVVAPVFDLLEEAIPVGVGFAEVVGRIAAGGLPLLTAGLRAVEPVVGTFVTLAEAAGVGLGVLATILDAIPTPVLTAAVGFGVFEHSLSRAAASMNIAVSASPVLRTALFGLSAAMAIWSAVTGSDTAKQQAHTTAVEAATRALSDMERPIKDRIADAVTSTDAFKELSPALAKAGITVDDLSNGFSMSGQKMGLLNQAATDLGHSSSWVFDRVSEVKDVLDESSQKALEDAVSTGKLTREQVIAASGAKTWEGALADAQHTLGGLTTSTGELGPVLAGFSGVLSRNKDDLEQFWQAASGHADSANEFKDAVDSGLIEPMGRIASSVGQMKDGWTGSVDSLSLFAVALNDPRFTDSDLQVVADALGVSLDELKGFASGAQQAIQELVSSAEQNVPTIADVFSAVKDDISANSILDELNKQLQNMADFTANVNLLISHGMSNAAEAALEGGPQVAAAIAQPVKDGNTAQAMLLEDGFKQYGKAQDDLKTNIDSVWGPALADSTGKSAKAASDAFGSNFHPEVAVPPALAGVAVGITSAIPMLRTSAFDAGTQTGAAFNSSVHTAMYADLPSIIHGGAAFGISVGTAAVHDFASLAGAGVGAEIGNGISAGLAAKAGMLEAQARAIAARVANAARAGLGIASPSKVFQTIGSQIIDGMVLGINDSGPYAIKSVEGVAAAVANVAWAAPAMSGSVASVAAASGLAGTGGDFYYIDVAVALSGDVSNPSAARAAGTAAGDAVGGAIVDRLTPAAARRFAVSTRVS